MQALFCTECGHKLQYSGAKPKFCSSCGLPIGGSSSGESKPRPRNTFREQMEAREQGGGMIDDGDSTDIQEVPQIEGLEYEISASDFGHLIHKFEDIINVSTEEEEKKPAAPKKRRGRPRKKS